MTSNITNENKPIPIVFAATTSPQTVSAIQAFVAKELEALPVSAEEELEGKRFQVIGDLSLELFEMVLVRMEDENLMNLRLVSQNYSLFATLAIQRKMFICLQQQILEPARVEQELKQIVQADTDEEGRKAIKNFVGSLDLSHIDLCQLREMQGRCSQRTHKFIKALISFLIIDRLLDSGIDDLVNQAGNADSLQYDLCQEVKKLLLVLNEVSMVINVLKHAELKLKTSQLLPEDVKEMVLKLLQAEIVPLLQERILKIKNIDKTYELMEKLIATVRDNYDPGLMRKDVYFACHRANQIEKAIEYAAKLANPEDRLREYESIFEIYIHMPASSKLFLFREKVDEDVKLFSRLTDDFVKLVMLERLCAVNNMYYDYHILEKIIECLPVIRLDEKSDKAKLKMNAAICNSLLVQLSEQETLDLDKVAFVLKRMVRLGCKLPYFSPDEPIFYALQKIKDNLWRMGKDLSSVNWLLQQ